MKKIIIGLLVVIGIGAGALLGAGALTKDNGSELSMALDNVNPLVKTSTVYAVTNAAVKKGKGGVGEDIYTYRMRTYDTQGHARWLTFTADKRLKLNKYLKIDTKGQNVNSWEAVSLQAVPKTVIQQLGQS
ncbi:YxeA family protein [Lactiplantibacillus sp. WILCCON 0030]|uniref:YxeA family protein n=1 Tax=Lactiplantibacillus brownii TaxID=3069269 RepID=A0ABU1AAA5_9LACO|nr:YxeA family protein [Lactiplantibacillus brownii]MDQ7937841.1 YxeA family protein [Lactiplantibacillus brownii]